MKEMAAKEMRGGGSGRQWAAPLSPNEDHITPTVRMVQTGACSLSARPLLIAMGNVGGSIF